MIEIWSKPQCPFCDKAENLCKQKNFEYKKDPWESLSFVFYKFPGIAALADINQVLCYFQLKS